MYVGLNASTQLVTVLIWKVQPKSTSTTVLIFLIILCHWEIKEKKFPKNSMRENKVIDCLVFDAMLKIAINQLTQKSTDWDLAHLLDQGLCYQNYFWAILFFLGCFWFICVLWCDIPYFVTPQNIYTTFLKVCLNLSENKLSNQKYPDFYLLRLKLIGYGCLLL